MRVRPLAARDAEALHQLVTAYDRHFGAAPEETLDGIAEWLADVQPELDGIAIEEDTALVGAVVVEHDAGHVFEADGYVQPGHEGRGVGTRLLEFAEARVAEQDPDGAVRSAHLAADVGAAALFAGRGYARVRSFYRMAIDLGAPPRSPVWPDGVDVSPLDFDRDAAAVHAVVEASFAEHWGFQRRPFDEWRRSYLSTSRCVPALSTVVRRDGDVVAVALNGVRDTLGFVGSLGVLPPERGRGLGLALLLAAFAAFRERGLPKAGLGVDAANASGAVRLYEKAGMHVAWQADVWELQLP